MTILDILAQSAKERVLEKKSDAERIKSAALGMAKGNFEFERALTGDGMSFICECKKASPSKGIISNDFPYLKIAKEYEAAGADCISVLTEPTKFLGKNEYLKEISENVSIPTLRKDFIVDECMIYEAKLLGAKAVLLICSVLSERKISEYIKICDTLGISALVEAHDEDEIKTALNAGARIIGVNNRNLKDFTVCTDNSKRLRSLVPSDILFVSESGIRSRHDIEMLSKIGADAVLIGETLMKSDNISETLRLLKEGNYNDKN